MKPIRKAQTTAIIAPNASKAQPLFLAGLHGSGASLVHAVLLQHPKLAGTRDAKGIPLEGQAVQDVWRGDDYLGGAGCFALHPRARQHAGHRVSANEREKLLS